MNSALFRVNINPVPVVRLGGLRYGTSETLLMCITWMPRLCTPMKDVASCDKLRSAARQALSAEDFRMGKPMGGNAPIPVTLLFFK